MAKYNRILIAGPTRSGTTFFANALATDSRPAVGEVTDKRQSLKMDMNKKVISIYDSADNNIYKKYNFLRKRKNWVGKFMTNHTNGTLDLLENYVSLVDRIFYCKRDIIDIIISLNNAIESSVWNSLDQIRIEGPSRDLKWILKDDEIVNNCKLIIERERYIFDRYSGSSKFIFLNYKNKMTEYENLLKIHNGTIKKYPISKVTEREDYKNKYKIIYNIEQKKEHIRKLIKDIE